MTEAKNYTCQVVGLIIAAIIVGVLSYYVGLIAPIWVAVIAFLVFLAAGYWLAAKFCGMNVDDSPSVIAPSEPAPVAEAEPVVEPTPSENGAPELLSAPRGGVGDDLKKVKGVGPKLEADLNAKGVWHYDQIASWSASEVAWADENLVKFKGRVSRDDWVGQAKTLAAGGDTVFSKKVDKGDVY